MPTRFYLAQSLAMAFDRFFSVFVVAIFVGTVDHNPELVPLVSTVQFAPLLLVSIVVGYLSDRYSRKHILGFLNFARISIFYTFCLVISYSTNTTLTIFISAVLMGSVSAAFHTTKRSIIPSIVQKNELEKANRHLLLSDVLGIGLGLMIAYIFGDSKNFLLISLLLTAPIFASTVLFYFSLRSVGTHSSSAPLKIDPPEMRALKVTLFATVPFFASAAFFYSGVQFLAAENPDENAAEQSKMLAAMAVGAIAAAFTIDRHPLLKRAFSSPSIPLFLCGVSVAIAIIAFRLGTPHLLISLACVGAFVGTSFAAINASVHRSSSPGRVGSAIGYNEAIGGVSFLLFIVISSYLIGPENLVFHWTISSIMLFVAGGSAIRLAR